VCDAASGKFLRLDDNGDPSMITCGPATVDWPVRARAFAAFVSVGSRPTGGWAVTVAKQHTA
jgi:hypothetical protein